VLAFAQIALVSQTLFGTLCTYSGNFGSIGIAKGRIDMEENTICDLLVAPEKAAELKDESLDLLS
jgi:hypothetical protein